MIVAIHNYSDYSNDMYVVGFNIAYKSAGNLALFNYEITGVESCSDTVTSL